MRSSRRPSTLRKLAATMAGGCRAQRGGKAARFRSGRYRPGQDAVAVAAANSAAGSNRPAGAGYATSSRA